MFSQVSKGVFEVNNFSDVDQSIKYFIDEERTFARRVFPVPGGPQSKAPLGIFAPRSVNRFASFKNSTNSMISFFASSQPATSAKVVVTFSYKMQVCSFVSKTRMCFAKMTSSIGAFVMGSPCCISWRYFSQL